MKISADRMEDLRSTGRILSVLSGFVMVISLFLHWEKAGIVKIWEFLGLTTYGVDALFHLDFLPVVVTLLFVVSTFLFNKHPLVSFFSIVASLLATVMSTYDLYIYAYHIDTIFTADYLSSRSQDTYIGIGMWIFAFSSLIGLLSSTGVVLLDRHTQTRGHAPDSK